MNRRKQMLSDLDGEIRDHLERETQDHIDRGLSPDDARAAALKAFGNVTLVREDTRSVWILRWLDEFLQDLRYGARMLRRTPGFTAVAVLTLALGIGATTAIFSAINGILIEHLPYANASRLLVIRRAQVAYSITANEARQIQQQATALDRLVVYDQFSQVVLGAGAPARRNICRVAADFFPMLGVAPLLGRPVIPADLEAGQPPVAVLSFRFWMDDFGGDPHAIGRVVTAGTDSFTIVGVMPRTFELGIDWTGERAAGFWVAARGKLDGTVVARVKEGVSLPEARRQLQTLSLAFARRFPADAQGVELTAASPAASMVPDLRIGLLILMGAVACVLLMASVNVSALLIARGRMRRHELAIRKALGASRFRVVRQLLTESLLLAVAGGALGLILAVLGARALAAIAPPGTPRLDRLGLDASVLGFTAAITLVTAVLFGVLPAVQVSSRRMSGFLGRGLGDSFSLLPGRQRQSLRSALVVVEVALAVILVIGGGLMARSLRNLTHIDTGVRADHVVTLSAQLSRSFCNLKDWKTSCRTALQNVLGSMAATPGVERVAATGAGPMQGGFFYGEPLRVEGSPDSRAYAGGARPVTPGFFQTMGMRLVAGRDFDWPDLVSDARVAIVSETFARKYLSSNPIGQRFSTHADNGHPVWMETVGVVNDVRDRAVRQRVTDPPYYEPLVFEDRWTVVARTHADPESMGKTLAGIVSAADKQAPISSILTLEQVLASSFAQPRFIGILLGTFGALGLLLAMIGIYGVIAYAVTQRTHEIGLRIALGAQPRDIVRLVVGQGAALAMVGVAVGLGVALMLSRYLISLLFGVPPTDPATFTGVAGLLLLVAVAACIVPARKALRVNPMVALRCD